MKIQGPLLAAGILCLAPASQAATYRRQSGTGKPAFSDKPGEGCAPITVNPVQPSPTEAAAALDRLRRDREEEAAKAEMARKAREEPAAGEAPLRNPGTK
jgi:hypothetical protein